NLYAHFYDLPQAQPSRYVCCTTRVTAHAAAPLRSSVPRYINWIIPGSLSPQRIWYTTTTKHNKRRRRHTRTKLRTNRQLRLYATDSKNNSNEARHKGCLRKTTNKPTSPPRNQCGWPQTNTKIKLTVRCGPDALSFL
ncbi:unnamed protein product, partial [Ectocarpus sp. 12 AP-2014]